MGRFPAKIDYENIRNARISENQARLASLGLHKTISELRSITTPVKTPPKRKLVKVDWSSVPLRRSNRLKQIEPKPVGESVTTRRSLRYFANSPAKSANGDDSEEKEMRPANAPFVDERLCRSPGVPTERRCMSKGRGSVYDPVFGICCHFCRQKKLCGEEDCKRCNDLDADQPCLGKTDCSVCHSSYGVLCRACLKVRYGEEMEEVRNNKQWKCPHCIEQEGSKPYWICNSSLCLKKRKMVPTGIAIFRAREMGFESVAHLVMDELQRKADKKCC
ncbi:zinc-finger domain of monoamine-oxidase A repressor R1 [Artemisia annua]|uniref:Zinc-finger domain of monoamine-oxidase A repressor R1 n=1 Tax=Artemisia annua TaxID=35608 RepID=A0A2U1LDY5_ARTAN|nr:zinc-finger domain of monoamine-oxidase A repressor R1 [Artemisia annua]